MKHKLIYGLRLASAAMQLGVVFFLSSISVNSLGSYSFATALLAIVMQAVQFEGNQLAIGGLVQADRLRRICATTNILWIAVTLATIGYFSGRPDVLVFTLLFILNLTTEWVVNLSTFEDRLVKNEKQFLNKLSLKIGVMDVALPLTLILWIYTTGGSGYYVISGLFTVAILFFSIRYVGVALSFSKMALPAFNFTYGVVLKRLDSMFIRVFTGITLGSNVLGVIQPLMSVARASTILTPTWININFSGSLQDAAQSNSRIVQTLKTLGLSYTVYIVFGLILFYGFSMFEGYNYVLTLCFAAVFVFGNQNTKAVLRSLNIMQERLGWNNILINTGIVAKCIGCYLALSFGIKGILVVCLVVDLATICVVSLYLQKKV